MNLNLLDDIDIDKFLQTATKEEQLSVLKYLQSVEQYKNENKIEFFKPEAWQTRAIALGSSEPYRGILAANRLGKTYFATYEACVHATGKYPVNWPGHRYDRPIHIMAMSLDWTQLARPKALQELICGPWDARGTGWLPKDDITQCVLKEGLRNTLGSISVRHYDSNGNYDGDSKITFAAYSGSDSTLMGTNVDFALLDEQCPEDIFQQLVKRGWSAKNKQGINDARILYVCTPEKGNTATVKSFYDPKGQYHSGLIKVTLWESEQYTQAEKERMVASIAPWQYKFSIMGEPSAGEGMVFAGIIKDDIIEDAPTIGRDWKRLIGVDLGFKDSTVFTFLAKDPITETYYLYKERSFTQTEAAICASNIRPLQEGYIPAILPRDAKAERGLGVSYRSIYEGSGMKILKEDAANWKIDDSGKNNSKLAGIQYLRELMLSGRFKVDPRCSGFLEEFDKYAYDENGKPLDKDDHHMDSLRYALMAIDKFGKSESSKRAHANIWEDFDNRKSNY